MELELIQNIRELTQRTAEDFDCFLNKQILEQILYPQICTTECWLGKRRKTHKSEANKVQKIFFYLETKEEESDTSHAPKASCGPSCVGAHMDRV